jgi:hypothetical protein
MTLMQMMNKTVMYRRDREHSQRILEGVFAGAVCRNSLYPLRKTLATPISSSDGSTTREQQCFLL